MSLWGKITGRSKVDAPSADPVDEELRHWKIVKFTGEGDVKILYRMRIAQPLLANVKEFRYAIQVNWSYEPAEMLPPVDVKERMDLFEERVEDLSAENDFSYLIQVSTGGGIRTYLYYTTDVGKFQSEFNRLLGAQEPFPIQLEAQEDSTWSLWAEPRQTFAEMDANFLKKRPPKTAG